MKYVHSSLLLSTLIAAVAGGAAGWFLRGRFDLPPAAVAAGRLPLGQAADSPGPAPVRAPASEPASPAVVVSTEDLVRQVQQAFSGEDPSAWSALQARLAALGMEDFKALVPHLKKLPEEQQRMVMYLIATRMGKLDPQGALAFGTAFAEDPGWRGVFRSQGQFRNAVVKAWAADRPDAALTWALTLPEGTERTSFLGSIALSLARSDPGSAVAVLEALPEDSGKRVAAANFDSYSRLAYVHQVWAGSDPRAAAASALALRAGPVRDEAFAAVAQSWAAKEPAAALDWVGRLEWGKARDDARTAAVRAWAKTIPRPPWNGRSSGILPAGISTTSTCSPCGIITRQIRPGPGWSGFPSTTPIGGLSSIGQSRCRPAKTTRGPESFVPAPGLVTSVG